jgi:hypothetical protein
MLSTEQVNAELARLTYRPHWSFRAYEDQWEGQKVRIVAEVPDSCDPAGTVTLGIDSFLPPMSDEWDVRRWLAWRLQRIEIHESLEFLKLDGAPIWDPHKNG